MAGFMAENLAGGVVKQFRLEDVDRLPRDGSVTLLDVRTPGSTHWDTSRAFGTFL